MARSIERSAGQFGLLANGSAGLWNVDVDESMDGNDCFLDLDSPKFYLVIHLRDLDIVQEMLGFLQAGPRVGGTTNRSEGETDVASLSLGWFGSASVSLTWDNEDFPRCFLIVLSEDQCAMRLSLDAEDIRMLIEALGQVLEDLNPVPDGDSVARPAP